MTQHIQFSLDGVEYLLEAKCHQQTWPRLKDRVIRELTRMGKESAKEMYGRTARAMGLTILNKESICFFITINPKGLNLVLK
jgi:hypothetical protein